MISTFSQKMVSTFQQKMVSTLTKNDFDSTKNDFGSTKNDFDSTNNDFDSSLSLSETLTWTLQRFCRLTPLFWEALCQIWSRFMERCIAETMPELSNFVDVQIRPVEEVSSISTSTSRSHAAYFTKSASKVIKTTKWAQDTKNGFDSNKNDFWLHTETWERLNLCQSVGHFFAKIQPRWYISMIRLRTAVGLTKSAFKTVKFAKWA